MSVYWFIDFYRHLKLCFRRPWLHCHTTKQRKMTKLFIYFELLDRIQDPLYTENLMIITWKHFILQQSLWESLWHFLSLGSCCCCSPVLVVAALRIPILRWVRKIYTIYIYFQQSYITFCSCTDYCHYSDPPLWQCRIHGEFTGASTPKFEHVVI